MARVLEELVREELSTLEKAQGVEKQVCEGFISTLVQQFKYFHGADTPALVKECALILGDRSTVEDYITLSGGGGDSVFLLRDFIARGDTKDFDRYPLYECLGNFIPQLTGKGQTADVDKILAFMKEMIQTEQGLGSARELDKILCAHLEFNEGLRRQSEEWKAKHLPSKPAQPPEATTLELPCKIEKKVVPWKLPLLIGIIVIGGAVTVWRCFRRKQT